MKQHAAIVIAALMITSMALAVSMSNVTATHTRTASIDDDSVKGDTSMVRVITIANDGPNAIDTVWIIVPADWGAEAVKQVPKDNLVRAAVDNMVFLPAGTVVELLGDVNVILAENTDVIVVKDEWIWVDEVGENTRLNENAMVEVRQPTTADNIPTGENIGVTSAVGVNLNTDNQLRLLADTMVLVVGDNIVRLPENTMLELVKANESGIAKDENVKTTLNVTVTLNNNKVRMVTDKPSNLKGFDIPTGENIALTGMNEVVIPAGTVVQLTMGVDITIPENTDVIREENTRLDISGTAIENLPTNWTQDNRPSTSPPGTCVEWVGDENNQIASGKSLDFPFAFTSPGSGKYTIYVRTTDTERVSVQTEITLTTDNTPPTIKEIAVSPEWAKANTKVTITVTASEPLAKLENVMVAENESTENVQVTMTSNADKTVWTGTYTTTDNENRDGLAKVWVIGEQLEDMLGNEGVGIENATFYVDKLKPPTPSVMDLITDWKNDKCTSNETWLIEGYAEDNYRASDNYPDAFRQENMKVKIRVGAKTYDVKSGANGYFYKSITLAEGVQEVGIQYIDLAGNAGDENAENITLDSMIPSIKWGTITGVGYTKDLEDGVRINDNAPKITLTISDAGLGVDNWDFKPEDNTGYTVELLDADKASLLTENLVNALKHDNHVLAFENTLPERADNTYYIYVVAGDNLQMENKLVKFVIDTKAPSAPSVGDAYTITSTMDAPVIVKKASRTIAGTAEKGADITVYGTVDTTEKVLGTATAGSDNKWTATFTLTAGSNTKIELSATDEAGNEGSRKSYGWMLADASAPSVTLDELSDTTDKTSITISGTVTKDAWEDWSEITLTVQVGTGSVEVPCVGGSYEYSLSLAEGPNTIVVQATDDIGNLSPAATDVVDRTVTPWATYAIVLVIVALVLAAIAIFRKR